MPKRSLFCRSLVPVVIILATLIYGIFNRTLDPAADSQTLFPPERVFGIDDIEGIDTVKNAVRSAPLPIRTGSAPIHAAILPHHTIVAGQLAQSWSDIAANTEPSVIVIIGPAHSNQGQGTVQTTHGVWRSVFGDVVTSDTVVDQLVEAGATDEPPSFLNEHAIGTHIPYIAHFFAGTPIVPIIAKSTANDRDAQNIVQNLNKILPQDALIIASIDFAHYLDASTTAAHDQITEQHINIRNYPYIDFLSSAYLDAPFALEVFLRWSDHSNFTITKVWHSQSHTILSDPLLPGTSYFIYFAW